MKTITYNFRSLAKKALDILDTTFDCRKAEPIYLEILHLIKENPESRPLFIQEMLQIFGLGKGPWELIQFCMRELQWPEIKEELSNQLAKSGDPREIAVLNSILAVYELVWEDSDLYIYYGGP
jgi:hypothetical protein